MTALTFLLATLFFVAAPVVRAQPAFQRTTTVEDGTRLGVGRLVADLELVAIDGSRTMLSSLLKGRSAVAIAMTSCSCPLSKKYAPRLAAIASEYADRDVAFVYVNTVAAETEANMLEQIRQFGLDGLYLPDRDQRVAGALQARSTTEVFVLDRARTLVYRGAVDDQYGVGTSLGSPQRTFLRTALDSVLDGERLGVQASWPPGCLLDLPGSDTAPTTGVTYFGRVARIVADKCVSCHRRGGDAPFGLESPTLLRGRLSMIEAMISDGLMPPWHGAPLGADEDEPWSNRRALTHDEREDLLAWLRSDRPLGDPREAPVVPPLPPSWRIGIPDLIVSTPALDLPSDGPMQYARLVTPTRLQEDRWLSSFELRPVKNDTVHHALVWILPPGGVLPSAKEIPSSLELLGAYSPGDGVFRFREGTGRKLLAGTLFIVDLYALPMGRPMASRLRIGMNFAADAPSQEVRTLTLDCDRLSLAAGESSIEHSASFVLGEEMTVSAVLPYMRARGHSLRLDALTPDGETSMLLDAPRYDYRWQIRYEYAEARRLAKGTRFTLRGEHDNGAGNPNNPAPGETATAGPRVNDDALFVVLEALVPVRN